MKEESKCTSPIMLCSTSGFDASTKIDALADRNKEMYHQYKSLAMGSEEGFHLAEKYIASGSKNGSWVLLRNVHLCPLYMQQLEKKLHSFNTSGSGTHVNFRLFLTSEMNDKLPTSLLRMCQTFVYEPPAGIKASLTRSLAAIPEERMNAAPSERSRLYFLLAWFHATILERLEYCPVGWSKVYEFSETDFNCALKSFDGWIDEVAKGRTHVDPETEIPWDALHAMLGQSLYGGRVDNEFDQRLLDSFIQKLFCAESFGSTFALAASESSTESSTESSSFTLKNPEGNKKKQFMEWIEQLPNKNSPTWLGLPETAEDMLLCTVGTSTLRKLLQMQDVSEEEEEGQEGQVEQEADTGRKRRRSVIVQNDDGNNTDTKTVSSWIVKLKILCQGWYDALSVLNMTERTEKSGRQQEQNATPLSRFFDRELNVGRTLLYVIRTDLQRYAIF